MTVVALAARGARGLLDLMLPPRCLRCGLAVDGQGRLCAECWRSLTFLGPPQCRLCGYPLPHALPEAPLWIGSGVTVQTAAELLDVADGVIVGSAFEQDGRAGNPVVVEQVEQLVAAVHSRHR